MLAMLTLAFAGTACELQGDAEAPPGHPEAAQPSPRVETRRVEVVETRARGNGFNPATIYRRLAPGVVTVISNFDPERGRADDQEGLGSGFVLDEEGYVATNAHVVTTGEPGAMLDRAEEVFVEFADGNRVPARSVGEDPNADVALLKIEPVGLSLTPLRLGSSRELAVGEPVAAIGSPFGEGQSLSVGVISAVDRDIESLTAFRIGNAIQTDAAINRGNSGGPLLDAKGAVIGINAQIRSTSGGGEGVGFSVPVDTVKRSLDQLRRNGRVAYAYLGVTSQPLYPQLADRLGLTARTGAVVTEVEPGSPADDAGIEAGRETIDFQGQEEVPGDGDVIVRADGNPIKNPGDLADVISLKNPGDRVALGVVRGHRNRTLTTILAPRPNRGSAPERPG